jgi:hypothetical protein
MRNTIKLILATASVALLAACGGGGGGDSSNSGVAPGISAEGAWQGSTSSGYALNVLVLENNEMWAVFGTQTNNVLTVFGFDRGNGTQSGSAFSGTGTEYFYTGSRTRGSFNATVNPGVSLNGTVTGLQAVTFNTTPLTTSYSYNTPAQISTVSGSWTGSLLDGSPASVNVSSTGSFAGVNSGCSFTGTVVPRPSGKNVFDATVTFGPSPCVLANQSASGIAAAYPTTTGRTQLILGLTNSSNTIGTMFFAQR